MTYKEYVPYTKKVEVTEHRAPTDESIRLYKEMEEKAERNIITREVCLDNELKGIVVYVEQDSAYLNVNAHVKYSLNGKEYHEIFKVPRTYTLDRNQTRMLLFRSIVEKLAQTFTLELEKIKY